jgi:hypothetical protein
MVKQNKNNKVNETKKKVFDPLKTWWGKALIWAISILMVAGFIIALVVSLPGA